MANTWSFACYLRVVDASSVESYLILLLILPASTVDPIDLFLLATSLGADRLKNSSRPTFLLKLIT